MLLKKLASVFFLFIFNASYATSNQMILIRDVQNNQDLPNRFRTMQDYTFNLFINTKGMHQLKVAGGAQFATGQLPTMLKRLNSNDVIIVDLREESHGFLNNDAVSWIGENDIQNKNKSPEAIEKDQSDRLDQIKKIKNVKVVEILDKENQKIIKANTYNYVVKQAISEKEYVTANHLQYQRFYVTDHYFPTPKEVDLYLKFIKTLPKHKWVFYHCEHGRGRTTTFMVLHDILFNAKEVSLKDIFARQDAIGGKNFAKGFDKSKPVFARKLKRLNFLNTFYQYARNNKDNYQTSFTDWCKQQHIPLSLLEY